LSVDILSIDATTIESLVKGVKEELSSLEQRRSVSTTLDRPYDIPPQPMAERIQRVLGNASMAVGVDVPSLYFGAGHDTMQVAKVRDAEMLSARLRGGYSHSPRQWTEWNDCTVST